MLAAYRRGSELDNVQISQKKTLDHKLKELSRFAAAYKIPGHGNRRDTVTVNRARSRVLPKLLAAPPRRLKSLAACAGDIRGQFYERPQRDVEHGGVGTSTFSDIIADGMGAPAAVTDCKFARNNDPLRGDFRVQRLDAI